MEKGVARVCSNILEDDTSCLRGPKNMMWFMDCTLHMDWYSRSREYLRERMEYKHSRVP